MGSRLATGIIITFAAFWLSTAVAKADPMIAAAGDVACAPSDSNFKSGNGTATACRQRYTSDLLVSAGLAQVLAVGDLQYDDGSLTDFNKSYDPTWGRVKSITRPALGNHEPGSASGYFDYFNGAGNSTGPAGERGKGYYSFDVGDWHLMALNSNCARVSCSAGSAQEQWLRNDLAAHPDSCKLAFFHHPRYSSGHEGDSIFLQPLWQDLYDAEVDVAVSGHSHDYERFAPQDNSGNLDQTGGVRQFVVGTGGAFFTGIGTPHANSEVRENDTYGVLFLTLHPTSYDWQFRPESSKSFTDRGSTDCHRTGATYSLGAGLVSNSTGKTLSYLAGASETNNVTITHSGSSYTITDTGVSTIPDADGSGGCSISGNRATCPASGVNRIRVDLLDKNDIANANTTTDTVLLGGSGADNLSSDGGNDLLDGGAGNDTLRAGAGNDILDGGLDNDVLDGGAGNDTLRGNTGTDTADYSTTSAAVQVNLATTNAQNTGGAGTDILSALENLTGGAGNDTLTGSTGANTLSGGAGDDLLNSRDLVTDQVNCDAGADVVTADANDVVSGDCETVDDGVPPDTAITAGPSGTTNSSSTSFSFTSTDANSTFECKLDSGSWVACSPPKSYTGLTKGSHTFSVRATDQFGNKDATEATRTWTIVFVPLASFTVSPSSPITNQVVTFTSTSTAVGSETIVLHEWDLDGDGTFETKTGTNRTASRSYPKAGNVKVGLRVTDNDGDSATTTVPLTISDPPPPPQLLLPPASVIPSIANGLPPKMTLTGRRTQHVARKGLITLYVECDAPCTVTAKAAVSVQAASKVLRTAKLTRALAGGKITKLTLKLSKKALYRMRRALARGKRVVAIVTVVSSGANGKISSSLRKIKVAP